MTARSWLLVVPMRPMLTNAVHNIRFRKASAERKKWRGLGLALAEQAKVPACTPPSGSPCWGVYGGRLPDP